MEKRKWTDVKALEPEIVAMRKSGKTRQEIADHLGLSKKQIINWVTRYNKGQAALAKGVAPKAKGRPRKDGQPPHQSESTELKRLRMENQLLRDFLQLAERGSGQG